MSRIFKTLMSAIFLTTSESLHYSRYCLQVSFSREQQQLTIHLKYAKMLAIVVHENMKLGDNTLNNERLTLVNTKFLPKYWRIVALILLPYNISIILKLKGHIKGRLISRILRFLKNLSNGLKIIR